MGAAVSVVIPVLDGARWLPVQLAALRDGQRPPFEVIVADNGSTDATASVASAFRGELDLRVVDASERRGHAYARNRGAAAASGALLLFLDHDDEVSPGYVEAMAAALEDAELVAARIDADALNDGWRRGARHLPQTEALPSDPVPWAYGGTLGIRRDTFQRLGGFREGFPASEDIDLCWRAHEAGVELTFVRAAVLRYRFPETLRGFFRQGIGYGAGGAAVDVAHGLRPVHAVWPFVRSLAGPARLILLGPSKASRASGLFLLGRRLGRRRALRARRR